MQGRSEGKQAMPVWQNRGHHGRPNKQASCCKSTLCSAALRCRGTSSTMHYSLLALNQDVFTQPPGCGHARVIYNCTITSAVSHLAKTSSVVQSTRCCCADVWSADTPLFPHQSFSKLQIQDSRRPYNIPFQNIPHNITKNMLPMEMVPAGSLLQSFEGKLSMKERREGNLAVCWKGCSLAPS